MDAFWKQVIKEHYGEREVVLLPGKYKTKLLYVRIVKNQESLNVTIELEKYLKKNINIFTNMKISNDIFFFNIEKDLKSICIYFERKYPVVFCYKKKVYNLIPYEIYKMDFKNPTSLFHFVKQNIDIIKLFKKFDNKSGLKSEPKNIKLLLGSV
jgi:hypothetical protein